MTVTPPDLHERPAGDVKIWFRFVPREGWLPYDTEGLWATRVEDNTARINNVPFLQDGVAQGDVVRFEVDSEGVHWARERVEASGNCTVRVLPDPDGPLGSNPRAVHEKFAPFNIGGEVFSDELPLVALNVPANADLAQIKALLQSGEVAGWWEFEVGCGTEQWWSA